MDHREEMQKEAERWQETAVKIIRRFRYGILIFAVLGIAVLLLRNLGFPQEVKHVYGDVTIFTESGDILSCTVRIEGETTRYPFAKNKYSLSDQLTVYVDNKRMLAFTPGIDPETGSVYAVSKDVVFAMTPDGNRILLETNLQKIYSEMDSQRCLLVCPGGGREYALLNLQERIGIPQQLKERFAWFTD